MQDDSPLLLIVDDCEVVQRPYRYLLSQEGFRVEFALNGQEALDKLRVSPQDIDVVLLDITLPGQPGGEVLVELRKVRPDLKVVLTSAHNLDVRNLDAIAAHPKPTFIRKPFRLNELVHALREEIGAGPLSPAGTRSRGKTSS